MQARKRRWQIGLGLVALAMLLLMVVSWALLPPVERISTYHAQNIQEGMTREQVEAILGGPAGDYRTPPLRLADHEILAPPLDGDCWMGNRLSVYIIFDDASDRVVRVTRLHPRQMPASWYQAMQQWLPLPD